MVEKTPTSRKFPFLNPKPIPSFKEYPLSKRGFGIPGFCPQISRRMLSATMDIFRRGRDFERFMRRSHPLNTLVVFVAVVVVVAVCCLCRRAMATVSSEVDAALNHLPRCGHIYFSFRPVQEEPHR